MATGAQVAGSSSSAGPWVSASGVTAFELEARLHRARPDVEVVGLEIDPARVARAEAQLADVRAGRTPFSPTRTSRSAEAGSKCPCRAPSAGPR